jgi:hypothetical protein
MCAPAKKHHLGGYLGWNYKPMYVFCTLKLKKDKVPISGDDFPSKKQLLVLILISSKVVSK